MKPAAFRPGRRGGAAAALCGAVLVAFVAGAAAAEIPRFAEVSPGLYRGGRPSEEDVVALREMGIKTILDLEGGLFETETEPVRRERHGAEAAGIDFVHVPLSPLRAPSPARVGEALAVIVDPARRPVFVHCRAGVDRTGFVVAAYRVTVEGWTPERAYDEMVRSGFHAYLFWWKGVFMRYAAAAGDTRAAYAGER
jgi:protein tyrosine/serine phosphatase